MSTVTVTELAAGSTAKAADINDTNASWNAATAAGQVGAENFREEGIDARVIAQNTVYTTGRGTNSFLETSIGVSGVAAPTAMSFGGFTYIGPIVIGAGDWAIVGYSLWGTDDIAASPTTMLQVSTDHVAWTDISSTTRTKFCAAAVHPNGTFAAKVGYQFPGTYYFRVLVDGTNADYPYGTLYAYTLDQ